MDTQIVKIPKKRIETVRNNKEEIERRTKTKIEISDSIKIKGTSLDAWIAKDIIRAIGRGFDLETAFLLLKEEFVFDIVDISEWAGKSKNDLERLKGRVIGRNGKAKRTIEELTNTRISISGKTISLIGLAENVAVARKAMNMLLEGKQHSTVFKFLEKSRVKVKEDF